MIRKTELDMILDGTSTYSHADSVKALYEHLNRLGNSRHWQLSVLAILQVGIEEMNLREAEAIRAILTKAE